MITCVHCGSNNIKQSEEPMKKYKCNHCGKDFNPERRK
jgi:transposase-like protein